MGHVLGDAYLDPGFADAAAPKLAAIDTTLNGVCLEAFAAGTLCGVKKTVRLQSGNPGGGTLGRRNLGTGFHFGNTNPTARFGLDCTGVAGKPEFHPAFQPEVPMAVDSLGGLLDGSGTGRSMVGPAG